MIKQALEPALNGDLVHAAPAFARHETFHPRYGWLKKGFEVARRDPGIFGREDAPVVLGVGKNMVRAIRYWCLAFKVLEEITGQPARRGELRPTDFGRMLFDDTTGLDPYAEHAATLWVLHWKLLSEPCQATAWYLAFNFLHRQEFTADELAGDLKKFSLQAFPNFRLADSSIQKDASCILRMYAENGHTAGPLEDSIDCPFVELGLVKAGASRRYFRFSVGPKATLPSAVVAASCLEYAATQGAGAQTISLAALLNRPSSPGQVFKLSEQSLYTALEDCFKRTPNVGLGDTAGITQLSFSGSPRVTADKVLQSYYQRISK